MTSSLNSLLSIAAVATLISLSIISGPIPILLITLFAGNIIWNLGLKIAKSQENDDLYILHNQQWSDDTTRSTSTPQQSEKRMRIAGLVPSVIMTITIATLLAVGILAAGPIGLTALGILAALTLYLAIDHAYASQQSKKAERSTCTRMTV